MLNLIQFSSQALRLTILDVGAYDTDPVNPPNSRREWIAHSVLFRVLSLASDKSHSVRDSARPFRGHSGFIPGSFGSQTLLRPNHRSAAPYGQVSREPIRPIRERCYLHTPADHGKQTSQQGKMGCCRGAIGRGLCRLKSSRRASSLARRDLDGDDRLRLVERDARPIAIREDDPAGL